ncbi:hypothetical protein TEA_001614 [Camellia sinensis var. sinensis]|uniref:tRNA intron endonuclease N-terminal domain-containing protein n=1 Tax=Camellia sinensis var. sinensis TaxID=542762 RepID=A0A4S4F2V7_CAMSN|nr:hypothetical protein TEA_001614 [Camellia sinensis var. sinensis]
MGPRWKGKESEAKALADPMSKIVSQLKSSLIQSDSRGLLSGCSVLLEVETEQTALLNRSCFGRPIITAQKDKQWFQLGGDGNANGRLRVWSDFQCTLRLCGSVAKTWLVLRINKSGVGASSPSCLESYSVEERTITRWSPEQSREDKTIAANGTK